uniref:PHD finger protein 3 n=1 Tax=Gasterosteus aculeatus aculeatus TaxID=481459 RepID=G3NRQ5_GASAC|nr:PHD finger protein 3 [Gasterosteus aculeatus aculeatus]XP_040033841.1 PHD finger protein 3 [Gasterosteus aculeatus aculeatus]XP_040033842.1 PHD finger protein 3 [Gasterosteus aculeatus aculeatus]XP_040033843.1 PHD finger protein 3 [Gasterosteus aculeatus aculeatus]
MDIVDVNHLLPSDQLDDTLIAGQNLECDASNEFGTGARLEDSLKNMLSDKDPMFGCASSQFNLLDNEESTFQIAGSTGPADGAASTGSSSELKVGEITKAGQKKGPCSLEYECSSGPQPANTSTKTMLRVRVGRKPANRLQKSFLIEKGVKGSQLKKELTLGGRVDVNDLDGGSWLNPSVVLRRLTVTIAGFRIELLPGPSYTHNVEASQSEGLDIGFSYAVLPGKDANVQKPTPENVAEMDVVEKGSADDGALGLGPYVNPNDVQTSNGTSGGSGYTQETNRDNQSVSAKQKSDSEGKQDIKDPQSIESNTVGNKTDKEKEQVVAQTLLKPKPGLTSNKNKDLVSGKPDNMMKGHKVSQNMPSKIQRGDLHKLKSPKDKKDISLLKRPAETSPSEHAAKMQKTQETGESKAKPKWQSTPSAVVKKSPSSGNRIDQQGPAKHTHSPNTSKVETANLTHGRPGPSVKVAEEGQEKPKLKKPEKILQRQKSKTGRSVSVDEPQLFIPDNAPVVKKETVEEQPANSETVWDGNNCCGLCKKHHNNMFMVGCGRCEDWFHGDCVGLDLTKVREMEEEDQMYVCLKCCEEESKKVESERPAAAKPEAQAKMEVQDLKLPTKPQPGPSQKLPSGGVRPDPDRKQSTDVREAANKTGVHLKLETKTKTSSSASKKPVSAEAIRRSVRDSLKEILIQRLKDSHLNVSVERASDVAKKTEKELFYLYKDTDNKYKNKYRSLMFNLKDTKNNVLFKRVLKGEISPGNLIRMSPEELASKELAAWRQRENRHTIEMIEKEQREAERRPITKITHKGEIEIESQEPLKASEPAELELPLKVTEDSVEPPNTTKKRVSSVRDAGKDTTSQHKSHLFDLNCKICTGRMAPPVEEAPTKVVKVATTVVRRQSTQAEETKSTAVPAVDDDLHLTVLEESFRHAQSGYDGRSDHKAGRDEEAAFLSNLDSLWQGLIHMHAVAKFMTKAFPVSGTLDNLTEDLPDSFQIGGRISPQTVWDYLEKIRATGTKEVSLIRFSPETEEDEISYTLLYAYFSSRRRFGVVSNNRKQVKDMYLIPLGATEKVPHQLVPFDGPGLENNRANLLLGLIIRQRSKRDFLPVDMNETARIVPEIKPITISTKETRAKEEEEKKFLSSLTIAHKKEKDKPLNATEEVGEPISESLEESSTPEETNSQESQKPLRFLPGVLLGWGGELPPLPDVGLKHPTTGDETSKTHQAPKTEASTENSKSPTAPRERFVIKKKEAKSVKAEPEASCPTDASAANNSPGKEAAAVTHSAPVSLKDKPPDVTTEAFLASLSAPQTGTETSSAASADKGNSAPLSDSEKAASEGNALQQPKPQAAPAQTNSSKPPLSGILKKSSAYSSVTVDKPTVVQKDKAGPLVPSPKPAPVSSITRNSVTLFHQGYLQVAQARNKPEEDKLKKEDPGASQAAATVTPLPVPEPQAPEAQRDAAMMPAFPAYNRASPIPPQQQQAQGPGGDAGGPPAQDQNHSVPRAQDGSSQGSGESYAHPARDKRLEERYSDPWERPRSTEDRDHHGRPGPHRDTHHGKRSRHHEREREKGERSHERERSRHRGHSEDRYGDKRKERHHSDDHRQKDRHRHRRDSDYENGRRSSKDS